MASAGAPAEWNVPEPEEKKAATHDEFKAALAVVKEEAEGLAAAGKIEDACVALLGHEKKTRVAGDAFATAEACVAIVQLLWKHKDLSALNAHILILAKRRAQLKQAITKMVQEAYTYVDQISAEPDRVEIITTLRTVTDGKIYVETERARLTLMLSKILEAQGKVAEASETLQEIAVETYGSMDKKEKAEFLLEQIRLCLAQRDFVRMQIIANKMSAKVLDEEGFEEIRVAYSRLMLSLHEHQKDSVALRKDFERIYTTRGLQERGEEEWKEALQSIVVYLALSPFDNETNDLEHRYLLDKNVSTVPAYKNLLTQLTTPEIITWPLAEDTELRSHAVLAQDEWYAMLHKRVVQHNIRVISKYYTRIKFERLCSLLSLEAKSAEAELSEMVSEKFVYAKIDRPAGVVSFSRTKPPAEVLAEWSGDVSTLLSLVEKTCHLINKENMVHGITS